VSPPGDSFANYRKRSTSNIECFEQVDLRVFMHREQNYSARDFFASHQIDLQC
jgi:hypothetical protein